MILLILLLLLVILIICDNINDIINGNIIINVYYY